jgi:hypothetical protein
MNSDVTPLYLTNPHTYQYNYQPHQQTEMYHRGSVVCEAKSQNTLGWLISQPGDQETHVLDFYLHPGSSLQLFLPIFDPGTQELKLHFHLYEHSHLELYILGFFRHSQDFILKPKIYHQASSATSQQQAKYVMLGKARAKLLSLIHVAPQLQAIQASQSSQNLILEKGSQVVAKPDLEIYSDEVEVSHGATVGFTDPEEEFFLQARGMPPTRAKQILTQAFIQDILGKFSPLCNQEKLNQRIQEFLRTA